uniref:hypothetical protein n=1 Tax=Siminovitchia fortis TaxID=254758 RepID=UPI001C92F39D
LMKKMGKDCWGILGMGENGEGGRVRYGKEVGVWYWIDGIWNVVMKRIESDDWGKEVEGVVKEGVEVVEREGGYC